MDNVFLLRLLVSFLVGGIWIALTTVIADRSGSKIGGFVGGLPSTVVLAYFFIAWTQGIGFAVEATNIFPLAQLNAGLFLVVYLFSKSSSFWVNILIAVGVWILITFLLLSSGYDNFLLSSLVFILFYIIVYVYFTYLKKHEHRVGSIASLSIYKIIFRFFLGGSVIALTVIMSELGGPVYGGVFSAFPAMFFSTVLLTYISQGKAFSRSIAVSLFSAGMLSVFVYVICIRYFFPEFGMWRGSLFSYVIAVLTTGIFYITERHIHAKKE